ncbi:hypothetical protein POTOM_048499 [Populus tomentosa]|uniref:Glutaredoxin domain-containing protein n=1 Tax=Populus tomentosa TaxID=118781 RepID=A0A8X7YP65_POPTO|nr:hypothetical protein POTOM_048499 [Populus tomentosa]
MGSQSLLVLSAPTMMIPSKIAASLAPPRPRSLCFPRALTTTDSVVFRVKSNSARNKLASSIRCALTPALKTTLDKVVTSHKVVLFMKGTKDFPQCGFSQTVVQILKSLNVPFESVNILENELLRQGLKEYSSWPTFPQLYIDGEFFGGCDITVGKFNFTVVLKMDTTLNVNFSSDALASLFMHRMCHFCLMNVSILQRHIRVANCRNKWKRQCALETLPVVVAAATCNLKPCRVSNPTLKMPGANAVSGRKVCIDSFQAVPGDEIFYPLPDFFHIRLENSAQQLNTLLRLKIVDNMV